MPILNEQMTRRQPVTLCATCIHRLDFNHDCAAHNPEAQERGGVWIVLRCDGHTTGAPLTSIREKRQRQIA